MHSADFGKCIRHPFELYLSENSSSTDDIAVLVADEPAKGSLGCVCLTVNGMILFFVCVRH